MAEGIVRIVLNAVDNYSGVLTGLNQGIELVSKGFGLANKAADIAGAAISSAISVAAKGGQYQELKNQLDNVAVSFGRNADTVISSIDRITSGMTRLPEAAKLAGRGIALGLDEQQLDKVFTFIKRRTELTGESFNAMSEQVFNALASGKGKSLFASFGIATKRGETLAGLVDKLERATAAYGDTGYNVADQLDALSAKQDDFVTKIGQAINATPAFQDAMTAITSTVVDFINTFDPRQLAVFFNYLGQSVQSAYQAVARNFPNLANIFGDTFSAGATSGERFTRGIISLFFDIERAAGTVVNGIITLVQTINVSNYISNIADGLIQIFTSTASATADIIQGLVTIAIDGFQTVLAQVDSLVRSSPNLAELLGVSSEEVAELDQNMEKAKRTINKAGETLQATLGSIEIASKDLFGGDTNQQLEGWKVRLEDVDAAQKRVLDGIAKIDYSPAAAKVPKEFIVPLAIQIDDLKAEAAVEKAAKAAKKTADTFKAATVGKTQDASRSITDIGKAITASFGEGELSKLTDDLFKIEEALAGRSWSQAIIDDKTIFGATALNKAADEIRRKLQFKATIIDESRSKSMLDQVRDYLAATNWPAELQALGEFLLSFILLKARGERLPLAITTST